MTTDDIGRETRTDTDQVSWELANTTREFFIEELLRLGDEDRKWQIRQMILDVMDICNQGDLEPTIIACYDQIQKDWFTP